MTKSPLTYHKDDIVTALKNAGLNKGDTAYFSTSLGMLGYAAHVDSEAALNQLFLEAFIEAVGESGTIIIPTYSYSFGGSSIDAPKIFDPQAQNASIGPFPNFFLQQPNIIRSLDPMMSMAALGDAESLFADLPKTSYGIDSLYERLLSRPNMKCVSVGLGPNWTPFIHYADYLHQVPHRYDKLFYGGIKHSATHIEYTHWLYSVPARIPEAMGQAHLLGAQATQAGIWRHAPLGRARVYVSDYQQYFTFANQLLTENKWLMTHGVSCDVLASEQKRMQRRITEPPAPDKKNGTQLRDYLQPLPRHYVDEGIDFIFAYLMQFYPFTLTKYRTGTNLYDWLVPEWVQPQDSGTEFASQEFAMGELSIGALTIKGTGDKNILICCYIDEITDAELQFLPLFLEWIDSLSQQATSQTTPQTTPQHSYYFALLPGAVGYAAYLTAYSDVVFDKAYHLARPDYDPLMAGNNPIASKKLADIPFQNLFLDSPL